MPQDWTSHHISNHCQQWVDIRGRHWKATLQSHCEWQVFFMATNVPMKDSTGKKLHPLLSFSISLQISFLWSQLLKTKLVGITTVGGRKSVLRLAQRMASSIYQAIGASSSHTWTKIQSKIGETIRIASRKNLKNPQEPTGLILCAVASVWLPVSPKLLFEFLIDESRRPEVCLTKPVINSINIKVSK